MAPLILEDPQSGSVTALGACGGSHIPTAILNTIMNLDWGLNPSDAVEYPRLHDQLYPQRVEVDDFYPKPLIDTLRLRNHNITRRQQIQASI
jgi:gamma-glutamyltranspeptidase/glutathione hydrolase/leukotriene-C4 hydrolase